MLSPLCVVDNVAVVVAIGCCCCRAAFSVLLFAVNVDVDGDVTIGVVDVVAHR